MADSRAGCRVPLSPARKIVCELLHHARKVPSIPLKRPMNVAALLAARAQCADRPSWVGMFLKAYAIVARDHPELRRTYVPFPWPHMYEHPFSIAAVLVERDWGDDKAVLAAKVRGPESQSLQSITDRLRRIAQVPFDDVGALRQLTFIARMPAFLRRFVFWSTINLSGQKKCKRFGTFMVGSLGNYGVEQCHPVTPLTTYLSFGPIAADGSVTAMIVYDHRVMDGRHVSRALVDLEKALNGPILQEVQTMARRAAA